MVKILFWCLFIYLAYRFIFELVIPITKTAGQLKKKMTEMQEQQAFQQRQYAQSSQQPAAQETKSAAPSSPKRDDYIDFEEVK